MGKLFLGSDEIGGGVIALVDALPTANQTEYNKHLLYLYNGDLYFIKYSSGTYSYKKVTTTEVQ